MAPPPGGLATQGNGAATASLVVGIVSLALCMAFVGGIVAVVLGVVGLGRAKERGGARRGQAIAGIILGVLSMLLGLGTWFALAQTISNASDGLESAVGPADRSTYDISVDDCTVSATGAATASGSIENRSDRDLNFEVVVEFVRSGSVLDEGDTLVFDVPAGDVDTWSVDGFVPASATVTCRISEVNNYLN